jgi:phosphoglycolate phosphatase-like HAD superfamily hydrolase
LDRNRPAPNCSLGIYTGRVYGETRHLIDQFAFFQGIQDQHICTIDRGYRKPEADALEYLTDALGGSSLIYFGDLPADRSAALAFRAKCPDSKLWLAQILETEETAYWPEADFVSSEPGSVLDWLGV